MDLRSNFSSPVSTVILAEGAFGTTEGKTANGVVMHSELFDVEIIVDSETAGKTADVILGQPDIKQIPVVESMKSALEQVPDPDALVVGVAPAGGELPEPWVADIQAAMREGCDIVSGLHFFFSDNEYWKELAEETGVRIFDVRKPPAEEMLRVSDGRADSVEADIVLTMGTDCAVGKRTTTFELYRAANEAGLNAGWIATGQTGIMVGAHRGVVIDRVPADFTAGVVEQLVTEVAKNHDLVFVEGQACLTHRAYSGVTLSILHGAWPDVVVLVDEPTRTTRTHFEQWDVEGVEKEIEAIERLSDATVAALSTWGSPEAVAEKHGLPAANVYQENGAVDLLAAVQKIV